MIQRATDMAVVRTLFREYADDIGLDLAFQGFAAELVRLPGEYAPHDGELLIAKEDGRPAGCVALKRFDATRCEMKRMYVRPDFRGRSLGRALAEAIIEAARERGYEAMLLDTLARLDAAIRLYRSLGFEVIPPYNDNPLPDVVHMRLKLTAA